MVPVGVAAISSQEALCPLQLEVLTKPRRVSGCDLE